MRDHLKPILGSLNGGVLDQHQQRQMSGQTHRSSQNPKLTQSDQSTRAKNSGNQQLSSQPNLAAEKKSSTLQPLHPSYPNSAANSSNKEKNLFLLKGTKCDKTLRNRGKAPHMNSETSSHYAQIKQKQIKLDHCLQQQNHQQRNNLLHMRYKQQKAARTAFRSSKQPHTKFQSLQRNIDRSNQVNFTQSRVVATTQTTVKTEDLKDDMDMNFGMIDQDSKIVVVRNDSRTKDDQTPIQVIKPPQVHYLGKERQLVKKASFMTEKGCELSNQKFWPDAHQFLERANQRYPVDQHPKSPQMSFEQTRKLIQSQRVQRNRNQKPMVLSADQTRAVLEQTSMNSLLSKPSNMLSQVLGITSPALKSSSVVSPQETLPTSSGNKFQTATTGTFSSQTARTLNSMRGRIKSQGGPRRKYMNQRQNIYHLMAKNLKGSKFDQSSGRDAEPAGRTQSIIVSCEGYEIDNLSSQQQHTERLSRPQKLSVMATDQNQGGQQAKFLHSTNTQFIVCEDQDREEPNHPRFASTLTTPTVASLVPLSTGENTTRGSAFENQRMDLPHMMSEDQASFMITKVMVGQQLEKKEKYHRAHKLRERASKVCSKDKLHPANGLNQVASEAFPISYKTEATNAKYTGIVFSEPKFNMQHKRKEKADYMQSTMSMDLRIPAQNSAYIMQMNDNPQSPYQKARVARLNSQTLAQNDETYALIDHHIGTLKQRRRIDVKEILKDIRKSKQNRKRSPVNVNELLLNQRSHASNQSQQYQFSVDPSYVDGKPVRRKIQILNMHQSNETLNMIQEGSTEIDPIRLSTKLQSNEGGVMGPQTMDASCIASLPEQISQELTMMSQRTVPPSVMQSFSLMQQQTSRMQDQSSEIIRKTMSPQPDMDNNSQLEQLITEGQNDQIKQGFISIHRNYQAQNHEAGAMQKNEMTYQIAAGVHPNSVHLNAPLRSSADDKLLRKSHQSKKRKPSSIEDGQSLDGNAGMATIYKEGANASFSPKRQMHKRANPNTVREHNLKKRGEMEKSIQISGVKMFEPQTRVSGHVSNRNSVRESSQERQVKYEHYGPSNQLVQTNNGLFVDPGTALLSPNTEENLRNFDNNVQANSHNRLDSYDGISTENKSPSLLYQRHSVGQERKGNLDKQRRSSDPHLVNLVVMASDKLKEATKRNEERAAQTPMPPQDFYPGSPLTKKEQIPQV